MQDPTIEPQPLETHGPATPIACVNYYPGTFSGEHGPRRPQRSLKHETSPYWVDEQNIRRVKSLLNVAKKYKTLSEKQLREIIYRLDLTHPEIEGNLYDLA